MQLNEKILLLEKQAYFATTAKDVLDFCSAATATLGVDRNIDRRVAAKVFTLFEMAEAKTENEPISPETKGNMLALINLLKEFAPLEYDNTIMKRARIKAKRVIKRIEKVREQMICPPWYHIRDRIDYNARMEILRDEQRLIQGHLKVLEDLDTGTGGIPAVAVGKFERAIKLTSIKLNEL